MDVRSVKKLAPEHKEVSARMRVSLTRLLERQGEIGETIRALGLKKKSVVANTADLR